MEKFHFSGEPQTNQLCLCVIASALWSSEVLISLNFNLTSADCADSADSLAIKHFKRTSFST